MEVCFSVISHGHTAYLNRLLSQMDSFDSLKGAKVIVTLNIFNEQFDPSIYTKLQIQVIRNKSPLGFGENHNNAFKKCDSLWFCILNPDLKLHEKEPFNEMINRRAESIPFSTQRVGMVVPRILSPNLELEDYTRTNLTPWSIIARSLGYKKITTSIKIPNDFKFFWVAGMCLVIRAEAFRAVNGFDERFFLYCEDYDLCARMHLSGWTILLDNDSSIIHEAQRDSHTSLSHLRMHMVSLFKVWLSLVYWRILFIDIFGFLKRFFRF